MEACIARYRSSANSLLSQYEPIVLVVGPLLALLVAKVLHSIVCLLQEKGIKGVVLGFGMGAVK